MTQRHAIIWLDHRKATVIGFSKGKSETHNLHSKLDEGKLHTKAGTRGSGHVADDKDFFDAIAAVAGEADEVLVTGPGLAKTAFQRYSTERHPAMAARIIGVETLDHPSEAELFAHARKSFKRLDQLVGDV